MKQNLKDYIQWNQPFKPSEAPLPTVTFEKTEPLATLEIHPHWVTDYADMGYRVCLLSLPGGYHEEFVTKDKFFSIVEGVKERFNLFKIDVYYDYEWEVM